MSLPAFIFTTLLVFQAGLVVTGGAVRLTGSGLGCPTWPECTDGSIKPVIHQAQGQLHAWIEFGNRLIAWLILILALAGLVYIIRKLKSRGDYKRLRGLAILQIAGFLGQVVLGGITVLTKLNPIAVSAHFVLTLPLIAGALALRHRILDRPMIQTLPTTQLLSKIVISLTFIVLVIGTVVTGTGPHAGDENAVRYKLDPRLMSWIHADAVILLIGLTIALFFVINVSENEVTKKLLGRLVLIFFLISLSQGAIGYIQYFTGLPEILVGAHLLGATLVWISVWRIKLTATEIKRVKK